MKIALLLTLNAAFYDSAVFPSYHRTFVMIKPEGVERNLVGNIIARFEHKGLKLSEISVLRPNKEILEEHYSHLRDEDFFESLIRIMLRGPMIGMIWEGENAIELARLLIGSLDSVEKEPGTIRGDFASSMRENVCHGSDCEQNAEKEIKLWFPKMR